MSVFEGGMTPTNYYLSLNRLRQVYNVLDYGATGDGETDDTVAIQTAINAAITAGGGCVYIPNGDYIIAGALQTDVGGINYKSQLYIPEQATFAERRSIEIVGETPPNFAQSWGTGGGALPPINGVRLISTLESSTTYSYVIANTGTGTGGESGVNYTDCHISNIQICITAFSHKLTLGGIGFRGSANCSIKNVTVFPYNESLMTTLKPTNTCVGIATTVVNGELMNYIENCSVGGFNSGYLMGDWTRLHNTFALCCENGYEQAENRLITTATTISALWCINAIAFTGGLSIVNIQNLMIELRILSKWYDYSKTIVDSNSYGLGEIHYQIHVGDGSGPDNSQFSKTGGSRLQCMPIAFEEAAEFTVTGARDESEGALKSLIDKLVAKGIIIDGTTAS